MPHKSMMRFMSEVSTMKKSNLRSTQTQAPTTSKMKGNALCAHAKELSATTFARHLLVRDRANVVGKALETDDFGDLRATAK